MSSQRLLAGASPSTHPGPRAVVDKLATDFMAKKQDCLRQKGVFSDEVNQLRAKTQLRCAMPSIRSKATEMVADIEERDFSEKQLLAARMALGSGGGDMVAQHHQGTDPSSDAIKRGGGADYLAPRLPPKIVRSRVAEYIRSPARNKGAAQTAEPDDTSDMELSTNALRGEKRRQRSPQGRRRKQPAASGEGTGRPYHHATAAPQTTLVGNQPQPPLPPPSTAYSGFRMQELTQRIESVHRHTVADLEQRVKEARKKELIDASRRTAIEQLAHRLPSHVIQAFEAKHGLNDPLHHGQPVRPSPAAAPPHDLHGEPGRQPQPGTDSHNNTVDSADAVEEGHNDAAAGAVAGLPSEAGLPRGGSADKTEAARPLVCGVGTWLQRSFEYGEPEDFSSEAAAIRNKKDDKLRPADPARRYTTPFLAEGDAKTRSWANLGLRVTVDSEPSVQRRDGSASGGSSATKKALSDPLPLRKPVAPDGTAAARSQLLEERLRQRQFRKDERRVLISTQERVAPELRLAGQTRSQRGRANLNHYGDDDVEDVTTDADGTTRLRDHRGPLYGDQSSDDEGDHDTFLVAATRGVYRPSAAEKAANGLNGDTDGAVDGADPSHRSTIHRTAQHVSDLREVLEAAIVCLCDVAAAASSKRAEHGGANPTRDAAIIRNVILNCLTFLLPATQQVLGRRRAEFGSTGAPFGGTGAAFKLLRSWSKGVELFCGYEIGQQRGDGGGESNSTSRLVFNSFDPNHVSALVTYFCIHKTAVQKRSHQLLDSWLSNMAKAEGPHSTMTGSPPMGRRSPTLSPGGAHQNDAFAIAEVERRRFEGVTSASVVVGGGEDSFGGLSRPSTSSVSPALTLMRGDPAVLFPYTHAVQSHPRATALDEAIAALDYFGQLASVSAVDIARLERNLARTTKYQREVAQAFLDRLQRYLPSLSDDSMGVAPPAPAAVSDRSPGDAGRRSPDAANDAWSSNPAKASRGGAVGTNAAGGATAIHRLKLALLKYAGLNRPLSQLSVDAQRSGSNGAGSAPLDGADRNATRTLLNATFSTTSLAAFTSLFSPALGRMMPTPAPSSDASDAAGRRRADHTHSREELDARLAAMEGARITSIVQEYVKMWGESQQKDFEFRVDRELVRMAELEARRHGQEAAVQASVAEARRGAALAAAGRTGNTEAETPEKLLTREVHRELLIGQPSVAPTAASQTATAKARRPEEIAEERRLAELRRAVEATEEWFAYDKGLRAAQLQPLNASSDTPLPASTTTSITPDDGLRQNESAVTSVLMGSAGGAAAGFATASRVDAVRRKKLQDFEALWHALEYSYERRVALVTKWGGQTLKTIDKGLRAYRDAVSAIQAREEAMRCVRNNEASADAPDKVVKRHEYFSEFCKTGQTCELIAKRFKQDTLGDEVYMKDILYVTKLKDDFTAISRMLRSAKV